MKRRQGVYAPPAPWAIKKETSSEIRQISEHQENSLSTGDVKKNETQIEKHCESNEINESTTAQHKVLFGANKQNNHAQSLTSSTNKPDCDEGGNRPKLINIPITVIGKASSTDRGENVTEKYKPGEHAYSRSHSDSNASETDHFGGRYYNKRVIKTFSEEVICENEKSNRAEKNTMQEKYREINNQVDSPITAINRAFCDITKLCQSDKKDTYGSEIKSSNSKNTFMVRKKDSLDFKALGLQGNTGNSEVNASKSWSKITLPCIQHTTCNIVNKGLEQSPLHDTEENDTVFACSTYSSDANIQAAFERAQLKEKGNGNCNKISQYLYSTKTETGLESSITRDKSDHREVSSDKHEILKSQDEIVSQDINLSANTETAHKSLPDFSMQERKTCFNVGGAGNPIVSSAPWPNQRTTAAFSLINNSLTRDISVDNSQLGKTNCHQISSSNDQRLDSSHKVELSKPLKGILRKTTHNNYFSSGKSDEKFSDREHCLQMKKATLSSRDRDELLRNKLHRLESLNKEALSMKNKLNVLPHRKNADKAECANQGNLFGQETVSFNNIMESKTDKSVYLDSKKSTGKIPDLEAVNRASPRSVSVDYGTQALAPSQEDMTEAECSQNLHDYSTDSLEGDDNHQLDINDNNEPEQNNQHIVEFNEQVGESNKNVDQFDITNHNKPQICSHENVILRSCNVLAPVLNQAVNVGPIKLVEEEHYSDAESESTYVNEGKRHTLQITHIKTTDNTANDKEICVHESNKKVSTENVESKCHAHHDHHTSSCPQFSSKQSVETTVNESKAKHKDIHTDKHDAARKVSFVLPFVSNRNNEKVARTTSIPVAHFHRSASSPNLLNRIPKIRIPRIQVTDNDEMHFVSEESEEEEASALAPLTDIKHNTLDVAPTTIHHFSPSLKRKLSTHKYASDLDHLKQMADKLHLTTRRPSYMLWKERLNNDQLAKLTALHEAATGASGEDGGLDHVEHQDSENEATRMEAVSYALTWLKRELMEMRAQDQVLARTLLTLRDDLRELKLQRSCAQYQEILEDAMDIEEEREILSELSCDYMPDPFSPTLKQAGLTKLNIETRRFSVF